MRRVNCPDCGIKVEAVPWAQGKHHLTTTYSWFLARWAKRLSWKEVAEAFQTSWSSVFRAVEMAVLWGRDHVDLSGIKAVGIDEIQWQTPEWNADAARFYRRLGATETVKRRFALELDAERASLAR